MSDLEYKARMVGLRYMRLRKARALQAPQMILDLEQRLLDEEADELQRLWDNPQRAGVRPLRNTPDPEQIYATGEGEAVYGLTYHAGKRHLLRQGSDSFCHAETTWLADRAEDDAIPVCKRCEQQAAAHASSSPAQEDDK